ncbi:hypothetical protein DL96DRAFT_1717087 [Flagelloscypha sp. PMI_526]|nr:hypothetical protein DL96DRAFT_1717087 [Flagelloscypha sp. PMI_526]
MPSPASAPLRSSPKKSHRRDLPSLTHTSGSQPGWSPSTSYDASTSLLSKSYAGCALSLTTAEFRLNGGRPVVAVRSGAASHGVVRKQDEEDALEMAENRRSKKARLATVSSKSGRSHRRSKSMPTRACSTVPTTSPSAKAVQAKPVLVAPPLSLDSMDVDQDGSWLVDSMELILLDSAPDFLSLTNIHRKHRPISTPSAPLTAKWVASTLLYRNQLGRTPRSRSLPRTFSSTPTLPSPLRFAFVPSES